MAAAPALSPRQDTELHTHTHFWAHLDALPVRVSAPHVPQDGVHGTAVVKLLLKLVRVT